MKKIFIIGLICYAQTGSIFTSYVAAKAASNSNQQTMRTDSKHTTNPHAKLQPLLREELEGIELDIADSEKDLIALEKTTALVKFDPLRRVAKFAGTKDAQKLSFINQKIRNLTLINEFIQYITYLLNGTGNYEDFKRIPYLLKRNDPEIMHILQEQTPIFKNQSSSFVKTFLRLPDLFLQWKELQDRHNPTKPVEKRLINYIDFKVRKRLGTYFNETISDFIAQKLGNYFYIEQSLLRPTFESIYFPEEISTEEKILITKKEHLDKKIDQYLDEISFPGQANTQNHVYFVVSYQQLINESNNINTIFQQNPKLILVVVFPESMDQIPDGVNEIPRNVTKLILIGKSIKKINHSFLTGHKKLSTVDLTGLSSVTSIGKEFLAHCSKLSMIDLTGLSNVTTIGDYFLLNCTSLPNVNLTSLSNVTTIGDYFLAGCTSPTNIDLSVLSNVKTIGVGFLARCSSLTSIDLTGLSNVTTIGDYFLFDCTSLPNVNLTSLSNVTTIGDYFLAGCISLPNINLSVLSNVTTIGDCFLASCSSLTRLDLTGLSSITTIGSNFLAKCSSLTNVDLHALSNVTTIGDYFLAGCTSLTTVDLRALSNVTTIGEDFLAYCRTLQKLVVTKHMSNIENVHNFIRNNQNVNYEIA